MAAPSEEAGPSGAVAEAPPAPAPEQVTEPDTSGLADTTPVESPVESPVTPEPEAEPHAEPALEQPRPAPALPDGWEAHPDVTTYGETRYRAGRGEREKQLRKEMGERETVYQSEVREAFNQGASSEIVTKLSEALENVYDTTDPQQAQALGRLLRQHSEWATLFLGAESTQTETGLVTGIKSVFLEAGLGEESLEELRTKERDLAWQVRRRQMPLAAALKELIKTSYTEIKRLGAAEEGQRRDTLERQMTAESTTAADRLESGLPPAVPGGAGGGGEPQATGVESTEQKMARSVRRFRATHTATPRR